MQLSVNSARLYDNASSRYDTVRYFNLLNALKKISEEFLTPQWVSFNIATFILAHEKL